MSPPDEPEVPDPEPASETDDLITLLSSRIVGQPTALQAIIPSIQLHRSGLAPEGRPVGVFLLLGPTGTGKTRTVEAIADVLHGDPRRLMQLLLGVLDRAKLRLGDGSEVDFSSTLIFLTSNLGAREMLDEIRPGLGFDASQERDPRELRQRLERIGVQAVRRYFSPEFLNRVDAVVTYRPLDVASIVAIFDQHVAELQEHVHSRLGARSFDIEIAPPARFFMIDRGTSLEYGARELKRVIHRNLTQPLAAEVANGQIPPGSRVMVELSEEGDGLVLRCEGGVDIPEPRTETVLTVDDNEDLLRWMERALTQAGFQVVAAHSVQEAARRAAVTRPDVAVLDYMLPDGDGASLAADLRRDYPHMGVVLVSGTDLDEEGVVMCRRHHARLLRKPFLAEELIAAIRSLGTRVHRAASGGI